MITEDTGQTTTQHWAQKTGQTTTQHWAQKTQDKQQPNTEHRRHRKNNNIH